MSMAKFMESITPRRITTTGETVYLPPNFTDAQVAAYGGTGLPAHRFSARGVTILCAAVGPWESADAKCLRLVAGDILAALTL
jgi:hypothetical protein